MNRRRILTLLFLCYALATVLKLSAPFDLDNRDQAKQGLYVIDVVHNGRIFLPTMHGVEPATKPPLYNWVAAGISLVWGDVNWLTIKLPAVLCGLGVVLVTFLLGEMLFSRAAGMYAGLILIVTYHFTALSCTARTDMMLCLFILLTLYFFLCAYGSPDRKSKFVILMFICMGLGTITKGPAALALPLLIIPIFLFVRKDLKWLKQTHMIIGITIWLLITMGWFIPAAIEGGRKFLDIIIFDEMINRFLGVGTRSDKARPLFYLVGHFFGKFMPWSLFVPGAILWWRQTDDDNEKASFLFPMVWFFAVLAFFSASKGKRVDYILPLYPAAAIIVAQFWLSVAGSSKGPRWKTYVRFLSGAYLAGCIFVVTLLAVILAFPDMLYSVAPAVSDDAEKAELLHNALVRQVRIFMPMAIALAACSVSGIVLARKGRAKALFPVMLLASGLVMIMYFEILSPKAQRLSGEQKKEFCERVAHRIGSVETLQFLGVKNSILFYMGKNTRPLSSEEAIDFLRTSDSPYLITTEAYFAAVQKDIDSEIVVLEESEYLVREEERYVLLGRKKRIG